MIRANLGHWALADLPRSLISVKIGKGKVRQERPESVTIDQSSHPTPGLEIEDRFIPNVFYESELIQVKDARVAK